MEFDIIGDVHGHADELEALLGHLGYSMRNGAYRHSDPNRMVLFLGDLIDRGPRQLDSIDIPRRMRDAGSAVVLMGNHELNAIGFATPVQPGSSRHLRIRGSKNRAQHKAFLDAVGEDSALHKELVGWMATLPMFFEHEGLRAAHACWHPRSLGLLKAHADAAGVIGPDKLIESFDKSSPLYDAAEIVLKGLEISLPDGFFFHDKGGHRRERSRVRWWDETATTYAAASMTEEGLEGLPEIELPASARITDDSDVRPVFFGHYWMKGTPYILNPKRTCLDFSIAKEGVLCAYSWRGEKELDPANLSWVGGPSPAVAPGI